MGILKEGNTKGLIASVDKGVVSYKIGGNDLNREVQRRTVLLCVIMIVVGVCLFFNAVSGLSLLWNQDVDQDNSSPVLASAQEVISAGGELNLTNSSEKIKYIQSHTNLYPEELLDLLSRNVETVDFVYSYPNLVEAGLNTEKTVDNVILTKEEVENKHPLFLQWDSRWGAIPYGSSMMALSGCGPTCLSMAVVGLTGNEEATPAAVARFSMEQGYYIEGTGTAWSLMSEGCANYGLTSQEISLSEEEMAQKLEEGCMLICSVSKGDFTQTGHFIVICGYENGWFEVNDPNSITRSKAKWKFDRLEGQIRNIWAMRAE